MSTRAGAERPLRFPVQWVNRPHLDFRGYAGTVASGRVDRGEEVVIHPSGKRAHVARIVTADGDLEAGARGRGGDADLRRGGRCEPRRYHRACRRRAVDRRPDRGAADLVRRGADAARPRLYAEMRLPDHDGDDLEPQIQAQCRQSRSCGRQDARAERGRLLQSEHGQGVGVRPLRGERRDRRVHPDRPLHQRDRGGGHDRVRLAPRHQYPVAGAVRGQAGARRRSRSRSPACCGSPGCPAPANRPSPIRWRSGCTPWAATPTCSTATISATASTRISASPMSTGWRISAAWRKPRSCSSMRG